MNAETDQTCSQQEPPELARKHDRQNNYNACYDRSYPEVPPSAFTQKHRPPQNVLM